MPLAAGTRLGPYEIIGPLGAGGMGEVYRARDSRLGRQVAVKALPADAARDPERLARFEREAQLLAAANHPYIAALHGIEELPAADGGSASRFIVLELLEGGTLDVRLRAGALPLREALTMARDVAEGLSAAHERGIIHRDIKPANIALTTDGHAKVLDFGLAKATAAVHDGETAAFGATADGVVLGTAGYMSPEQARGLPTDKRTDIWSFGCVLFEMLSGRHPFAAATLTDTVARVLNDEPDWALLPANTPERLLWIVRRCLEKDARRRLRDIADAAFELEDVLRGLSSSHAARPVAHATPRMRPYERALWAGALAAALLLAGGLAWWRDAPRAEPDSRPILTSIVLPDGVHIIGSDPARFTISPDGTKLALIAAGENGRPMLWVRPLDGSQPQVIPGTEGASHPFWSPDSRSLGFIARPAGDVVAGIAGILRVVDDRGIRSLTSVRFLATPSWGSGDVILFTAAGNGPLSRVSAAGGTPTPVTTLDAAKGDVQHSYPEFLPDGKHFLYSAVGSRAGGATDIQAVYIGSLDSTEPPSLLIEGAANPRYASGHVLFVRSATLLAQPFDTTTRTLSGEAKPVAENILGGGIAGTVSSAYSVSQRGDLVYQSRPASPSQMTWVTRQGKPEGTVGPVAEISDVVLSPDGQRVATSIRDQNLGTSDIWIYDTTRGVGERFTSNPGSEYAPVWPRTGSALIFSAIRDGSVDLYRQEPQGSEERLDKSPPGLGKFAASWSPDGNWVLYIAGARIIARSDLMLLPLSGDRRPQVFRDSEFVETQGRFSPDGRWIAYVARSTDRFEVYIGRFPRTSESQRVSVDGGQWPTWNHDGTELYFVDDERWMSVATITADGSSLRIGPPRRLFKTTIEPLPRLDAYPYGVTPDGSRFLINMRLGGAATPPLTFVSRWPELLRR